jgi:galactitol-specific phosphotransferase system IIB component
MHVWCRGRQQFTGGNGAPKRSQKKWYDERDFHFEQADLTTGRGMANSCDILVTTPAFVDSVDKDGPPAVYIKNLFSEAEIEEKFMPVLKKVLKKKKD